MPFWKQKRQVALHIAPLDAPQEQVAQQHLLFHAQRHHNAHTIWMQGENFQCTPFQIKGEWWGEGGIFPVLSPWQPGKEREGGGVHIAPPEAPHKPYMRE